MIAGLILLVKDLFLFFFRRPSVRADVHVVVVFLVSLAIISVIRDFIVIFGILRILLLFFEFLRA
jgi:hypothetical protein